MKLKGKVAFVTGFGSGLGQAIAIMFAKEGAAVAGTSKTEAKGLETVATIEKAGGKALFRAGDVCDSAQMKTLIDDTVSGSAASISSSTAPACAPTAASPRSAKMIGIALWIPI